MRETAVGSRGGKHETITLQAETRTPRARTLSASFVRERTPQGELPPAQRQRKKNEGKARARALDRLDPVKHEMYLESERVRKRDAALRAARGELVLRGSQKRSRSSCTVAVAPLAHIQEDRSCSCRHQLHRLTTREAWGGASLSQQAAVVTGI